MDIKRLSTAMLISALVMLAIMYFWPGFFGGKPPVPPLAPSPNVPHATAAAVSGTATKPEGTHGNAPAIAPPELITLGSAAHGAPYKLEMVINNVHASVERVRLNIDQYSETVAHKQPLTLLQADPNATERPFATTEVQLNSGNPVPLLVDINGNALAWHIDREKTTATTATLYLDLTNNDLSTTYMRIEKIFEIDPKSYEVRITHHVINMSNDVMDVRLNQTGPISLWDKPPDDFRTDSRTFQSATFDETSKQVFSEGKTTKLVYQAAITKKGADLTTLSPLGSFGGNDYVVWVAASNRFFTSIVRPVPVEPVTRELVPAVGFLDSATVEPVYIDETLAANSDAMIYLLGKPVAVAANGSRDMALSVYMGPKKKEILEGDPSAPVGSMPFLYYMYHYIGAIQYTRGSCSFMTFPWLARAILQLLDWIRVVTFNWGVAIMILVIVVRALMHPLTRYSQVTMAKMQGKMAEVQPELDRIKKKYPKDNAMQQQEKMRVFKEHNINPAGSVLGCLPMLLQMPIWAALYSGLAIDIDLRQAGFIPGWISDLSNPDMIYPSVLRDHPYFTAPLIGAVYGLNLLPILLGLVFFLQMRYSMKSAPKAVDPQQAQTQKISQFMFLLFPIMLYNAPSGLNLYIFASSVGGFFDTWLIRRHMKEKGILPAQMGPSL